MNKIFISREEIIKLQSAEIPGDMRNQPGWDARYFEMSGGLDPDVYNERMRQKGFDLALKQLLESRGLRISPDIVIYWEDRVDGTGRDYWNEES